MTGLTMLTITECSFLIIKYDDPNEGDTKEPDSSPPSIIGMIIAKCCEFDTALRGKMNSVWGEAFHSVQEAEIAKRVPQLLLLVSTKGMCLLYLLPQCIQGSSEDKVMAAATCC